jgi:hypothetical protein
MAGVAAVFARRGLRVARLCRLRRTRRWAVRFHVGLLYRRPDFRRRFALQLLEVKTAVDKVLDLVEIVPFQ